LDGSHADIIADRDDNDFFIMINASPLEQSFTVAKAPPNRHWYRVMDTALAGPVDFLPHGDSEPILRQYTLRPRSVALLFSREA
jgi:glycogen operon protein